MFCEFSEPYWWIFTANNFSVILEISTCKKLFCELCSQSLHQSFKYCSDSQGVGSFSDMGHNIIHTPSKIINLKTTLLAVCGILNPDHMATGGWRSPRLLPGTEGPVSCFLTEYPAVSLLDWMAAGLIPEWELQFLISNWSLFASVSISTLFYSPSLD